MGEPIILTTKTGKKMRLLAVLPAGGNYEQRFIGMIAPSEAVVWWPKDEILDLPSPEQLERLVGRGLTTDMLEPAGPGRVRYVSAAEMENIRFSSSPVNAAPTPSEVLDDTAKTAAIGARRELFIGWTDAFLRDVRRLSRLDKIEFGTADLFMLDNLLRDAGYSLPEDRR